MITFNKVMIVLTFLATIYLVNKFIGVLNNKNSIELDRVVKDIDVGDGSLELLDTMIAEALDDYIILHIAPKQLDYINNNIQNEITDFLKNEIPKRISTTVLTKICYKYDRAYVPELIASRIYITVLNYVLDYNTSNMK